METLFFILLSQGRLVDVFSGARPSRLLVHRGKTFAADVHHPANYNDWDNKVRPCLAKAKSYGSINDIQQQIVEEVRQSQVKTQLTIAEFRNEKSRNVDKVEADLKEMEETVDSLEEDKYNDTDNGVLRQGLAVPGFTKEIAYYAERFQSGTREWVFDVVQKWLNDRSCVNRVMVISGNAGIGKSVFAAVLCKRMHEADILAGSHFFRYNNVRRSKPELIIHSLARQLSHSLPKYKHALSKRQSRNHCIDTTSMNVEELFEQLLKEPLSSVDDPGRNMLMVIDGLDESECEAQNDLLDVIANQFCKLPIWIRFLVTTRPALNIAEKLKDLNVFELKCNDERNLEDIRVYFQQKLEYNVKVEDEGEFLERLVSKSEGLMLFARFLMLTFTEISSRSHKGDAFDSLPSAISPVYQSYFKRLERELCEKLDVKRLHFLALLSAIAAAREPLPVGFVTKLLVPSSNFPLGRPQAQRVLSSVSALFPVHDGCFHLFHTTVKDWLTDARLGAHEFVIDQNEGHRVLSSLCTDEHNNVKRKGVHNRQFSATEKYALYHGAHHILHEGNLRTPDELEELTKAYVIDLEILYAKTCLNSTIAGEDLVWLKEQGISTLLTEDSQRSLDTLLFLLRTYPRRFTDALRNFLQTERNQGGKVLTVEASNLLRKKYLTIPFLEDVHKAKQQEGSVLARFECSSVVVCLDVSPQLDYMVCESNDGKLQLWSLLTGQLVWNRPVLVEKRFKASGIVNFKGNLPSDESFTIYRSVVFHPTKECVLPGILSQAYTMDGNLKPLFPGSNCRFSVCSISGDKTKILTNSLECSKCLVLWSLENGSEVDRILEDEDILSFALSGDGRLLAISHYSGLIRLVDGTCGFRTLAQTTTSDVCGMMKFSPDGRFLCCRNVDHALSTFCLRVVKGTDKTFSLKVSRDVSHDFENFESYSDCRFLSGDLVSREGFLVHLPFVLDEQRLLRCKCNAIEMVKTKDVKTNGQGESTNATGIALSLDGQTVYVASDTSVAAYDAFSGKLNAEINCEVTVTQFSPLCPVRVGVLFTTRHSTVEFWDYDLSRSIKIWNNLPDVEQLITISEEQVAVVRTCEVKFLDTSNANFVATIPALHQRVLTCNSKWQLLTFTTCLSLQLLDDATVVWKREAMDMGFLGQCVAFSPLEQFLVVGTPGGMLVLNAETGSTLLTLPPFSCVNHCAFISDDECVIFNSDLTVHLLNVKSGELLSAIDVEGTVTCLAACPLRRLLAIGLQNSSPNFKVFKVHSSRFEDIRNRKR